MPTKSSSRPWQVYSFAGTSSAAEELSPAPAGILYNFDEWYVPKAQQRYTSG